MITPSFYPEMGGVQRHVLEVGKLLVKQGHQLEVIASSQGVSINPREKVFGIQINRFSYPKIKLLGLLVVWWKMLSFWKLAAAADVIHVHDVMLWSFPLRILFPRKNWVLTMHGWEGVYPLPKKNIFLKKLAGRMANKVVGVGEYISQHYGVACDQVIYGGVDADLFKRKTAIKKICSNLKIVFVGRLSDDTGVKLILDSLAQAESEKFTLYFAGDGPLRNECEETGQVLGWLTEEELAALMSQADLVIVGGYLSALESLAVGCETVAIVNNPIKKDYWSNSPLDNWLHVISSPEQLLELLNNITKSNFQSKIPDLSTIKQYFWGKIANQYLQLYQEQLSRPGPVS